ncbi:MAG TPA: large conductance mechanosensitive channel protein MscL [Candidatus Norongarragalinales archaeon]|nr:large conductance mechanosensitive channel protein MscL [Candidatus Norongarragalinales archaeon]
MKEFMEFLKKYQVIGLAVAFIMGAAASSLITALVNDFIMPIIALVTPSGDWKGWQVILSKGADGTVTNAIKYGDFLGVLINFIIVAFVIFMIVKMIMKEDATAKR